MSRKKTILLLILAAIVLLMSGIGSSFYWLVHIYLPDQINTDENIRRYSEWYTTDSFVPPADLSIGRERMNAFLQVNESLVFLLKKMQRPGENNRWRMAMDLIQSQPEWIAHKYQALKKFNLSPREYEWIEKEIMHFWIYRWKEISLSKLQEFSWTRQMVSDSISSKPVNYTILLEYEKEINGILNIFWSDHTALKTMSSDSQ
jgi:hypothetical protein